MKRVYCTLFDKNYLLQAVALHGSLLRHTSDFKLFALCMDEEAYILIERLGLASLSPISVEEILTPEVMRVRERTTHGQFCWVCQPLICEFILDRYSAEAVTYLESDSLFFSDPEILFEEQQDGSATLVPHNYSPDLDNSETAGKFCVQFNAFRNDAAARSVLSYWKEWCFKYDKAAPHLYPGQTCLDDWPERFDCVAIIRNPGAGVAPWNTNRYVLRNEPGGPTVDGHPVVFFHYHQYGRLKNGDHELGQYPLSDSVVDIFYAPYVAALREADRVVKQVDPEFNFRREYPNLPTLAGTLGSLAPSLAVNYLKVLKRRLRNRFNVHPDSRFDGGNPGRSVS